MLKFPSASLNPTNHSINCLSKKKLSLDSGKSIKNFSSFLSLSPLERRTGRNILLTYDSFILNNIYIKRATLINPWKPVPKKKHVPYTLSLKVNEETLYSIPWTKSVTCYVL